MINVSATCVIISVVNRVLQDVNKDLNAIFKDFSSVNYDSVRNFVIDYSCLEMVEMLLYSAFATDNNQIFYQEQDSEDWRRLKSCMHNVEISDKEKYQR
jgi:hypothetical protein